MVRMVVFFAGWALHWPVAGHGQLFRTEERVEKWARDVFEVVFGKGFAVYVDADGFVGLGEFDGLGARGEAGEYSNQANGRSNHGYTVIRKCATAEAGVSF